MREHDETKPPSRDRINSSLARLSAAINRGTNEGTKKGPEGRPRRAPANVPVEPWRRKERGRQKQERRKNDENFVTLALLSDAKVACCF